MNSKCKVIALILLRNLVKYCAKTESYENRKMDIGNFNPTLLRRVCLYQNDQRNFASRPERSRRRCARPRNAKRTQQASLDELRYVQWTFFRGKHHYQWDKQQNHAIIKWDDIEVVMALNEVQGSVRKGGQALSGEEKQEHINTAWNYWCNDSFWLIAPYKVFDPGVERSVINEDRKKGLLVQYQSGGVTPGDAYLWWLDETNKPTSWQMWTSILPMQGIENSWEGWKTLPGGAMVSTVHDGLPMKAEMSNVNAGMSPSDIGLASADAFRILAD